MVTNHSCCRRPRCSGSAVPYTIPELMGRTKSVLLLTPTTLLPSPCELSQAKAAMLAMLDHRVDTAVHDARQPQLGRTSSCAGPVGTQFGELQTQLLSNGTVTFSGAGESGDGQKRPCAIGAELPAPARGFADRVDRGSLQPLRTAPRSLWLDEVMIGALP